MYLTSILKEKKMYVEKLFQLSIFQMYKSNSSFFSRRIIQNFRYSITLKKNEL